MTVPSSCALPAGVRTAAALGIGGGAPAEQAMRNPFALVDLQARRVEYLRVSVTDRCNFRCSYCMPAHGVAVVPRDDLLRFDEIARLVRRFVDLGVRKVRLTGGEPLLRRDIVDLVGQIADVGGIDDLAMTTNAHLLRTLAAPLRQAGLQRLNVSLDTLDAGRFAAVTRQGDLATVLGGLDAADAAGFTHTKLNAVVLRGLNDGDLGSLAAFGARRGYLVRFIEYMPIGVDAHWGPSTYLPAAEMRERLAASGWSLTPDPDATHPGGGPARHWLGVGPTGERVALGFIAAVSEKFCRLCNRVRLSATGTLRECLSARGTLSLRDQLRAGATDDELRASIRDALLGKVDAHRFDANEPTYEAMSSIGG